MPDRTARTREEDLHPGGWEQVRRWWQKWGDLIVAVVATTGAIVAIVAAVLVYDLTRQRAEDARVVRVIVQEQAKASEARAQTARETAATAKRTCERTRRYAPYLIKDYEDRGVLPPALIADYQRTLPKTCPK